MPTSDLNPSKQQSQRTVVPASTGGLSDESTEPAAPLTGSRGAAHLTQTDILQLQRQIGNRATTDLIRRRTAANPPAPAISTAPKQVQRTLNDEQMRRIAMLSFEMRIEVLSQLHEDDYEAYLESSYFHSDYLGGEVNDEVRERRKKLKAEMEEDAPESDEMDSLIGQMSGLSIGKSKKEKEDDDLDSLIGQMSGLSIGKSKKEKEDDDVDDLIDKMSALSIEEPSAGEAMLIDHPVEVQKSNFDADGDVVMSNVDGSIDADINDVHGSFDVEMADIKGDVYMEVDHVFGDVDVKMEDVTGDVHLILMDIDARQVSGESETPTMGRVAITITNVAGHLWAEVLGAGEPMELSLGPVKSGEKVVKRVDKRKRKDKAEDLDPRKRRKTETEEGVEGAEESGDPFGIESLTDQFSRLSVSFYSDIDKQTHEIYPSSSMSEVIVESNPTPLKSIIAAGKWQNVVIPAGILIALGNLQTAATNALSTFAPSRSKKDGNALRKALRAIAKQLAKIASAVDMPPTDMTGSTNHGSDASPTEGKYVKIDPLSLNSKVAGHKPNDGRLMKAIRKAAKQLTPPENKNYKQMHLLNDNVFGPGQLWNLTPGTSQSNVEMEKDIEHPLKKAIINKGLVIKFEATVNYANDPMTASNIDIEQNPNKYRFQSITFKAREYEVDSKNNQYKLAGANTDKDVKKVDGAVLNWKWGGTTPLVAKPKILDPATTEQQLTDVGISAAAAKRIVAYVKANAPIALSGKDKKGQLRDAVAAYDNKKRYPEGTWKATDVLWT